MANIKELAAKAGVSPSTASIVIGGKSETRKISKATQEKVWKAAKEIGYRPNVSARRLRDQHQMNQITIAVYWSSDFRASLMTRFLHGLQEAMLKEDKRCEFLIHPYKNDHIEEVATVSEFGNYHAAIICNASPSDIAYLESMTFPIPIILYNRTSDVYSTVCVNDENIGQLAAEVFIAHQRTHALLVGDMSLFPGMKKRIQGFEKACEAKHIKVSKLDCKMTMKDAYEAIQTRPLDYDAIFALSDYQAIGILRYLKEIGCKLPKDMELIAVGNADSELEEFASTPLSVVELPMEDMAAACLKQVIQQFAFEAQQAHIELEIRFLARKTTR